MNNGFGDLYFLHLVRLGGKQGVHELENLRFGGHGIDPFLFGVWKQKIPPRMRVGDGGLECPKQLFVHHDRDRDFLIGCSFLSWIFGYGISLVR